MGMLEGAQLISV